MIPDSTLFLLRAGLDVPKDWVPKIPRDVTPLDALKGVPYLEEIRIDIDTMKGYKYTEDGWKEIV